MSIWTAQTVVKGRPEEVLEVLTDAGACTRWAPIAFAVEGLADGRLVAGGTARVTGRLAGRRVGFALEVHEAAADRLLLQALGPIGLDVAYEMAAVDAGCRIVGTIGVTPGSGLTGQVLARATDALLAAGALDAAMARIAREVDELAAVA